GEGQAGRAGIAGQVALVGYDRVSAVAHPRREAPHPAGIGGRAAQGGGALGQGHHPAGLGRPGQRVVLGVLVARRVAAVAGQALGSEGGGGGEGGGSAGGAGVAGEAGGGGGDG